MANLIETGKGAAQIGREKKGFPFRNAGEIAKGISANPLWASVVRDFGKQFPPEVVKVIYKDEKRHLKNVTPPPPESPFVAIEVQSPTEQDKVRARQNSGYVGGEREIRVFKVVPPFRKP